MNFQRYGRLLVALNGTLLAEHASASITADPGLMPQFSVAKGLCGVSQGSPQIKVSIEEGVPAAGMEYNPFDDMLFGNVVTLTLIQEGSGQSLVLEGFIMGADISHSVNAEQKIKFDFLGRWNKFE